MKLNGILNGIKAFFSINTTLDALKMDVTEVKADIRDIYRRIDHLETRIDRVFELLLQINDRLR